MDLGIDPKVVTGFVLTIASILLANIFLFNSSGSSSWLDARQEERSWCTEDLDLSTPSDSGCDINIEEL